MRIFLTTTACLLIFSGSVWADQPKAPNTAAKAAEAALAFLSGPSSPPKPQSVSEISLQQSWEVTKPAAAVWQQYRAGLDSLQTGDPAPYLALLAPDYQHSGAGKDETIRRLTELLARNRCASARFSFISARMESADRLVAEVWQELVFTSKDTPTTYVTTSPGKTYAVNQTGRLTVTQLVRQEWRQSGAKWLMQRSEIVAQKATAVL